MKRLVLILGVLACMTFLVTPAAAAGPQSLPDAACNQGTVNARAQAPSDAAHHIPGLHDFDSDGVFACYHRNPTYPPPSPTLE
jgi:hypothetical protein